MATGYTRQSASAIQAGNEIKSADLNNEFQELIEAFDNSTGHDHSGSSTNTGAKIPLTSAVTGVLPIANGGTALSSAGTAGQILISNGSILAATNFAFTVGNTGGPFSTTSTSSVHAGIAFAHTLTKTNRLLISVSATLLNNSPAGITQAKIKVGTGAAPTLGTGEVGTTFGPTLILPANNTLSQFCTAIGLGTISTVGTAIWVDLAFWTSSGATQASLANVYFNVLEIG